MDILTATTEAEARALAAKAYAWAVANQRAVGSQWSEVHTDGTSFGITFDPSVQPAFTKAETGETVGKLGVVTFAKVQSVQQKVTSPDGKTTTGAWQVKPAPPPVIKG